MKRMRIVGLALVAVMAMGVAAASASAAEPVFFGKAELGATAPTHIAFAGTGGVAYLEGKTSKLKIECKAFTATGETTGPKSTAKNVTKFTNCEIAGLALPCESTGAAAKEIVTNDLVGELGAVSATLPGMRLKPEEGTFLADFQCAGGGVLIHVKGSVIGSLSGATATTVEAGKLAATIKYTLAQTGGKQKYQKFVGESGEEQLTSVVSEFNSEKGEYVTHEELGGQSAIVSLKTSPAGQLGLTKP